MPSTQIIQHAFLKPETQASLSEYAHFTASLDKLKKLILQAVIQQ